MNHRLIVYNRIQFNMLKQQFQSEGKLVQPLSVLLNNDQNDNTNDWVFDISALIACVRTNDAIQFQFEQIVSGFQTDKIFIVDDRYRSEAEYCLRFWISNCEVCDIETNQVELDETEAAHGNNDIEYGIRRITDLSEEATEQFVTDFSNRLYGHQRFKTDFEGLVSSFRIFNRIGEHKVLSFFLMGDSGVGKTEVARAIHKAFGSKRKLAKINFGNYSSHDALNSLIGSPLGYIGSDGGELIQKIQESDVGIILIDEFEKADSAVFNYFLDVLDNM